MIVVLTREAEHDLERIGDFIARDSPVRAMTFVAELTARCQSLAEIPLGFPVVTRYKNLGIRRRVYGDYLIFYRIAFERIEVLHVLNGALDYETIVFRDE